MNNLRDKLFTKIANFAETPSVIANAGATSFMKKPLAFVSVAALSSTMLVIVSSAAIAIRTISGSSKSCPYPRKVAITSLTTGNTTHTYTVGGTYFRVPKGDVGASAARRVTVTPYQNIQAWSISAATIQGNSGATCLN